MDLNSLAQTGFQIVAAAAMPAALAVATWALRQAQARWKFTVSQTLQDTVTADIESVVNVGIGWGRAKLARGEMQLAHVSTGNAFIDQIAQAGFSMLSAEARASGITTDDIARRVVAGIGHALGNDPSVPTIAPPSAAAAGDSQPAGGAVATAAGPAAA